MNEKEEIKALREGKTLVELNKMIEDEEGLTRTARISEMLALGQADAERGVSKNEDAIESWLALENFNKVGVPKKTGYSMAELAVILSGGYTDEMNITDSLDESFLILAKNTYSNLQNFFDTTNAKLPEALEDVETLTKFIDNLEAKKVSMAFDFVAAKKLIEKRDLQLKSSQANLKTSEALHCETLDNLNEVEANLNSALTGNEKLLDALTKKDGQVDKLIAILDRALVDL